MRRTLAGIALWGGRPRPRRTPWSGPLFATIALCAAPLWAAGIAEYELKAAFLFNALRFVDWPSTAREQDLIVGVVGSSAMEGYLRALESSPIRNRRLRVVVPAKDNLAGCCRVLFFGKSSGAGLPGLLDKAHGAGVLTVGNDSEFLRNGGMMALVTEGRRLIIEIDAQLARRHGFIISSQLLEIARVVDGPGWR